MNREQRQALLHSDRMFSTEDLTEGEMYHIQHLNPSDADYDDGDTTVIVLLETYEGAYIYTSWPACPLDFDDVFRINKGALKCMMTYRTISEPRIFYIFLYFNNAGIFIVRREYIQTYEMHSLKLNMLLFISMDRWLIIIVIMAAWRH
jgi:hypothetical protein